MTDLQAEDLSAAIIGAGQAGLAMARVLQESGIGFALFDGADRVGDSWRNRFDSLRLFSPRSLSQLPGFPMAGSPDSYPGKNEVADYLESYARRFGFPLSAGRRVERLRRQGTHFTMEFEDGGTVQARSVIICAGAFQLPVRAEFARRLSTGLVQFDARTYRNPRQLPPGQVLVIGGGATGRQIALEVSRSRETWLSVGHGSRISAQRFLGKDVMRWARLLGLLDADKDSLAGRLARRFDSFPGPHLRDAALRKAGIRIVRRAIDAEGDQLRFEGGIAGDFSAIVWAMGYRDDTDWIDIEKALDHGRIVETRGVSPVPGLFYCGRHWQRSRASALICGAADDAAFIADEARRYLEEH